MMRREYVFLYAKKKKIIRSMLFYMYLRFYLNENSASLCCGWYRRAYAVCVQWIISKMALRWCGETERSWKRKARKFQFWQYGTFKYGTDMNVYFAVNCCSLLLSHMQSNFLHDYFILSLWFSCVSTSPLMNFLSRIIRECLLTRHDWAHSVIPGVRLHLCFHQHCGIFIFIISHPPAQLE